MFDHQPKSKTKRTDNACSQCLSPAIGWNVRLENLPGSGVSSCLGFKVRGPSSAIKGNRYEYEYESKIVDRDENMNKYRSKCCNAVCCVLQVSRLGAKIIITSKSSIRSKSRNF